MPFVFEQPNLGKPDENHLYFDPGDGRLLTVFTNESRDDAAAARAARGRLRRAHRVQRLAGDVPAGPGPAARRAASSSSSATAASWTRSTCTIPNGLKVELACYKFETPEGFRDVDVLMKAHQLRVERGDHHITEEHLADAIEALLATRARLRVEEPAKTTA